MKYLIVFTLLFLEACSSRVIPITIENEANKANEVLVFHQYCLSDKFCTDSLLIQILNVPDNQFTSLHTDTIFKKIIVEPIVVEKSTNQEIVRQFLLSLEAYNYYDSKIGQRLLYWTQYAFFDHPAKLKNIYNVNIQGDEFEIYNLQHLVRYDFKAKITRKVDENGIVTISFDSYDTYIRCSQRTYKEFLFPKYLNYISKEPRRVLYNSGQTKKVRM